MYGHALSLISPQRLDEAVAPLKKNTKLQPMSPYGWYQLARVQHDRGRLDETQTILDHLATFEPKVAAQLARETGLRASPRHDAVPALAPRPDRATRSDACAVQAGPGCCVRESCLYSAETRAARREAATKSQRRTPFVPRGSRVVQV